MVPLCVWGPKGPGMEPKPSFYHFTMAPWSVWTVTSPPPI